MIKKIINNEDAGLAMLEEVMQAVTIDSVIDMLFMPYNGFPTVSILIKDYQGNKVNYLMRATTGEEIFEVNQLLRSFDLGIMVEFKNFTQYDLFIDYCMNLIKANRKATA
ncbi:hypothetical protein [Alkaliphilus serpentinus]|uniref:Uncharacterized protein n=1 Tax=Alkaliphilus serpentinus TaxID=1482731 RepID=A0A833M792_9FIRM|nr:hypothetical protein [Alkaliphilus serpentinus]KAB3527122.1 hypothetical protein F8153_13200 [Alkaliphilus serpentinus]